MQQVLTGLVLSASAGLNAFIPMLVLAVFDRVSNSVNLERPFDIISTTGGILVLLGLVTFELILDKIPRVDALMDLVGYIVRPASGAFLMMAVTYGQDSIDVVVAMLIGLLVAGAVHMFKAKSRSRITAATNGIANPMVSMLEDFVAGSLAIVALLAPVLGAICAIAAGVGLYLAYDRLPTMAFWQPKSFAGAPGATETPVQQDSAG